MKKLIFLSFALCFSIHSKGQSNLQFKSAKYLMFNVASGLCCGDTSIIVPPGMVWKIESCGASPKSVAPVDPYKWEVKLNLNENEILRQIYTEGAPTSNTLTSLSLPIWLPSGTYTFTLQGNSTPVRGYRAFISGIEFALVN